MGGVLLCVALGLVLVAASLFLLRFGLPLDLAFLIVAAVAIVISLILLRSGVGALKPSRLVPAKASRKSHLCLEVSSAAANLATSSEQKPIGCERRSALRWARCDLGSRLRTLPRRRPHAWAWPICRGPARLTMRANGIRSRPRFWVGRRTLDYVGGPKSRKTGPPRSCDRAFKRLVGIDSPIRDKSVSGASRGKTARVSGRRSIASGNGSDNALRRNRQETGERYRPPTRRD